MNTSYEHDLIAYPELMRQTGASRGQVDQLRYKGTLRPRRIGSNLFFEPVDLIIVREYIAKRISPDRKHS